MSQLYKIEYLVPAHGEKALLKAIQSDAEAIVGDINKNAAMERPLKGLGL